MGIFIRTDPIVGLPDDFLVGIYIMYSNMPDKFFYVKKYLNGN